MRKSKGINRRSFLRNATLGVVGAGVISKSTTLLGQEKQQTQPGTPKIRAYRTLGRTGFKASDLGIGGIDNVPVIKAMLDAGVNYIDTGESYGRGKSETSIGQAIKGYDRKSLFITTKLHLKASDTKEDILRRAGECLKRLDTEYVDCLMTHCPPTAEMVKYDPFHQVCAQLKNEGKVRFVGISNHGSQHGGDQDPMDKVLLAAAQDGRFDVMLMVYNFIQKDMGESVIKACQEKNIGVTLMKTNPVGNYLAMKSRAEEMKKSAENDPERLKRMESYLENVRKEVEQGEWFIKKYNLTDPAEIRIASTRFVLSHPGVTTVLARVDSFEDVEQFLKASGTTLSESEAKKLAAFTQGPGKLYCRHACGQCESSCPHHVPVNTIMRYNHYFEAQGNEKYAMLKYAQLPGFKANLCESCSGMCQNHCPYGVPIQGLLTMAHMNLTLA